MKKAFIYVNGCDRRLLDANRFTDYLTKNNYLIVDKPMNANLIIFLTCAFSDEAANHSLKKIEEFQKNKAELIVAGCIPAIEKEKLSKIFKGKTIITNELNKIDEIISKHNIKFINIDDANLLFQVIDASRLKGIIKKIFKNVNFLRIIYLKCRDHIFKNLYGKNLLVLHDHTIIKKESLYYLRISNGCISNCSYCVIKNAIGPLKSKPVDQCINEFKNGLNNGYKHFVITADDVGSYGVDIGTNFAILLDEITKISGEYDISILSLHPQWLVKYIDYLEKIFSRKKIKKLEIPIQSSNSRILKLMNRYSDTEKMKEVFLRLNKYSPNMSLVTHCILGFPTEKEEEFKETLSFIVKMNIQSGYIYPFSCKTGSKIEKLEPKVPKEIISRRLKISKKYFNNERYNVFTQFKPYFLIFEKRT